MRFRAPSMTRRHSSSPATDHLVATVDYGGSVRIRTDQGATTMSEVDGTTDTPTAGIPSHRYTAALARRIETAWQERWEREGTFHAPNPTGPLSDGFDEVAGRPQPLRAGHVPVPERRWAARRPPAGLHRHRRLRPLPADVRAQRAAHDGLRRVRPARRAVRDRDRAAPPDHHRGQHPATTGGSCAGWDWATTCAAASPPPTSTSTTGPSGSSCRSSTPGTTRPRAGPARSPSWWPSWTPGPASRPRAPTRTADRGRS